MHRRVKFQAKLPKSDLMRLSLTTAILTAATLALVGVPDALADTSNSSNWAGYSVHRSGVNFRQVVAAWRQPTPKCTVGNESYSAVWVGLGGYSQTSNALEQIGTEADCSQSGKVVSSAWYELVPAASRAIRLRVRPGDLLGASVTVAGHRVVVALTNTTTHRSFTKTMYASSVDVSSAEWIVEAPSDCITDTACQTLPLANFGSATFSYAGAVSTTGHSGAISDPTWGSTKIQLIPGGRRFVAYQGSAGSAGAATPSALAARGTSFKVTYSEISVQGNPFFTRRNSARAGRLVHPGR
jgi:hypothetical protein